MAAGKTLVGGTAYEITGGKTRVTGTNYTITGGKTLVGGTVYTISFKEQTLKDLFQSASISYIAGRNASSNGEVSVNVNTAGTYYAFVFCNGYMGITKLVSTGSSVTKTLLQQVGGTTYGQVYVNGTTCYCSNNGTSAYRTAGQTIAVLKFNGYTEAQIEALLTNGTYDRLKGRNSSKTGTLSTTSDNLASKIAILSFNNYIGISFVNSDNSLEVLVGNHSTNPSLLLYNWAFYLSTNGTSSQSCYGGSILSVI